MLSSRRRLAAAGLVVAASSTVAGAGHATDKVRCAAAYEQAQVLRRQDKLSAARAELLICEQACPSALAADCTKWRGEVETLMPVVRLRARDSQGNPADARVFVDGVLLVEHVGDAPVAVDSGDHTFRFESPSGASAEVHASLHAGERAREIEAVLGPTAPVSTEGAATGPEPTASRGIPVPAIVVGAIGVAGLALGAGLSLDGHLQESHLRSSCAPGCSPDQVSSIATLYDVAWVSAGVGIAAFAVAIALWRPWESATTATPAAYVPYVAPTMGGAAVGMALP
jgi:hypothetical protein